jgi:hypothetical protein
MKKRLPSPAMVVALIALGVALGGTSVAATTGLVTGTQLRAQTPPPSVAVRRLQRRVTALEWEVNNNICRNRTLVSSASVDTVGHLSVQYVSC